MRVLKLFACLLVLCAAIALVSCDQDKHTHDYKDTVVAPTCTSEGYTEHVCACGESYRDEKKAPSHTVVTDAAVAATCQETGLTEGSHCSACNTVLSEQGVVPVAAHNFVDYVCTVCKLENRATEGLKFQSVSGSNPVTYQVFLGEATDEHIYVPAYYNGAPVTHVGWMSESGVVIKSITLPATITHIGDHAFENNREMTEIHFAEGTKLQSIGYSAFSHCAALRSLELPDGVTEIGDNCFSFCVNLLTFKIPKGVTKLGSGVFNECRALLSVTLPDTLVEVEDYTFSGCNKLVEVYNLSALTLRKGADTHGLVAKNAVAIHTQSADTSIVMNEGDYYFLKDGEQYYFAHYAGTQTDLVLPDDIDGHAYGIYANACRQKREDRYTLPIRSVTVPNTLLSVGAFAFEYCEVLTTIKLPATVETIGESAFASCYQLRGIGLDETSALTSIGESAFRYCYSLADILLPAGLTQIGERAFEYCQTLVEVYDLSETLTVEKNSDQNGFVGFYALAVHTTPLEESILVKKDDFLFTYDEQEECYQLIDYHGEDAEVVIPALVNGNPVSIYRYAFAYRTDITRVSAASLLAVGKSAFCYCSALVEVEIEDARVIGEEAFYRCTAIEQIRLPNTLEELGYCAFGDCSALKAIQIPGALESIYYPFVSCNKLTDVYYGGTRADWENVENHDHFDIDVTWHYETLMP